MVEGDVRDSNAQKIRPRPPGGPSLQDFSSPFPVLRGTGEPPASPVSAINSIAVAALSGDLAGSVILATLRWLAGLGNAGSGVRQVQNPALHAAARQPLTTLIVFHAATECLSLKLLSPQPCPAL